MKQEKIKILDFYNTITKLIRIGERCTVKYLTQFDHIWRLQEKKNAISSHIFHDFFDFNVTLRNLKIWILISFLSQML